MANKNDTPKDELSEEVINSIRDGLGLPPKPVVNEAYVTQAKKFNLSTELLSNKAKLAHQQLFERYVESLNEISAQLDTVDRDAANSNHSNFRSLKIDEVYNCNAAFLHALYFENISDLHSKISMDSLSFIRLERDFGTFDAWQKDFIACAMSSRNGWAVTVYNGFLKRYMNVTVDLHNINVPINCYPVVILDMWEHSYYRDYLDDKKAYIFAMMKQLNWSVIENRFKDAEKISKVLK
jgi:superoxide dismutase, Fe-Mn family